MASYGDGSGVEFKVKFRLCHKTLEANLKNGRKK